MPEIEFVKYDRPMYCMTRRQETRLCCWKMTKSKQRKPRERAAMSATNKEHCTSKTRQWRGTCPTLTT